MRTSGKVARNLEMKPGGTRILQWLARYPLQRLDDLEVALAPWQSRSTISRFLSSLLADGLIEAILPGMAQGKRLYHLSHKGALWLASSGGSEAGPHFSTEREKLIRWLPRLPAALPLQDCINGLVAGAARALTRQGRRAILVRWDWQRAYTHTFLSQARKRPLAVHLDGALALCLRYDARYPSEEPLEVWYHLFLLRCLLDDARLMRQRLDRLLRWRESAERWSSYSQMPPVLILATTPRQAERWRLVSEYVAETLRVNQIEGAVACFPSTREADTSPWRWNWRTLETNRPCSLRDLLVPQIGAGIPGLATFTLHESLPERKPLPVRKAHWPYDIARYVARASSSSDDLRAAFHLTPLHWSILHLLYAHPLLNTSEIATFSAWNTDSVEKGLAQLQRTGYIEAKKTLEMLQKGRARRRWMLAEKGLLLLAAGSDWHVLRLARPRAPAGSLQQRGLGGLLNQLPHTVGVYDFFARLSALAGHLRWWESGMSCARRFYWKHRWYSFQPDACAEYQIAGLSAFRFWLEWDQGTMNVRDLERKLTNYAAYLDAREWAREHLTLPSLLFVVPEIDQERRVSRCARDMLLDAKLHFYTTTRELMRSQGLDAPIWRRVILQADLPAAQEGRVALFAGSDRGRIPAGEQESGERG